MAHGQCRGGTARAATDIQHSRTGRDVPPGEPLEGVVVSTRAQANVVVHVPEAHEAEA